MCSCVLRPTYTYLREERENLFPEEEGVAEGVGREGRAQ